MTSNEAPLKTKTASIALIGPPNAGKSSLSNALIGARVSAVSRKRNTTRSRTTGAYTENDRQLVFYDCPGVVERHFVKDLGFARRELTAGGWGAAADADIAILVFDVAKGQKDFERCTEISRQLIAIRGERASNILVLNKCDLARPRTKILLAAEYFQSNITGFDEYFKDHIFMVSAYSGRGVADLRNTLLDMTTEGEFEVEPGIRHCDEDLDLVRQHIWEKLLHCVHNEVPYRSYFENDELTELPSGDLLVSDVIRVKRRSMIPILIGKGGGTISWIRENAEKSASEALGRRVHLQLRVKLAKG